MRPIFYDLTELLYLSSGYKSFYGIAKVVAEGAREAFIAHKDVRFVAFSQSHNAFFEVFPAEDSSFDRGLNLNVPNAGIPFFTRRVMHKKNTVINALSSIVFPMLDSMERWKWKRSGAPFKKVDLSGGAFVSCARPKLMVHSITALQHHTDVTIHALLYDLIPLHETRHQSKAFPQSFLCDTNFVIRHADHIISISQFTADDILRFSAEGIVEKPKKISVAPLVHEFSSNAQTGELTPPDTPYLLMVGTQTGRKNLNVVLEAIKTICQRGETPPKLVLAGRRRQRTMDLLDTEEMSLVKPHVIQIDSPAQPDLERLYKGALAVVLPSRVEGWGLPAAEALWFNVPPICADVDVLHEVCGNLALYFEVDDSEALADHICRLNNDSGYRSALSAKIRENRAQLRVWRDFGADLMDSVYSDMMTEDVKAVG